MFAYAHFLVGDDETARALQRAVFIDAHQAMVLGARIRHQRAWLLKAVRDTAGGKHAAEELLVLRKVCGLGGADAAWVLGDEAAAAKRLVKRGMRIGAGAGAGAAVAARASTAKALAAQIPGFSVAGATGAGHLVIVSAVAGTALVGTAAVTTRIEQRAHPTRPAHTLTVSHGGSTAGSAGGTGDSAPSGPATTGHGNGSQAAAGGNSRTGGGQGQTGAGGARTGRGNGPGGSGHPGQDGGNGSAAATSSGKGTPAGGKGSGGGKGAGGAGPTGSQSLSHAQHGNGGTPPAHPAVP